MLYNGNFGDWFPPTFMSTGTRDMMLSSVLRFTDVLQAANGRFNP
jgi:acetyl esterase/lipase